jgi:hypothetical protein
MRQRLAVAIDLGVLRGSCVRNAVRAGKQSIQIIEAAIFRIDHDDVLDSFEPSHARCGRLHRAADQHG